ncbi:MAG: alanine racemase [Deltaproteobacteria bacterium]|nr:alanine racemase [Deltaproteobacteria bacterium]
MVLAHSAKSFSEFSEEESETSPLEKERFDGRPTCVEIDLERLAKNFRAIRDGTGPSSKILAVVKANAYGHGAIPVAKTLCGEGAHSLGVATVEEGIELRCAGIELPILVLGGFHSLQIPLLVESDLTPVLFDLQTTEDLYQFARKAGKKIAVHVKVDTGMGRLGILPDQAESFFQTLKKMGHFLTFEGLLSHFASADGKEITYTQSQIEVFQKTLQQAQQMGLDPIPHIANSAAILKKLPCLDSMVRPGILLYGYAPSSHLEGVLPVEPILSWKTRVLSIREVPVGFSVSYGESFVTRRRTRLAVLPVGYADGYPRLLSNRGEVLVRGRRAPVVGRVCMDLTMVDLTEIPESQTGDEVILIGKQGQERLTADDMARWSDTISYEVLCGIGRRVPRRYRGALRNHPYDI